MIMERHEFGGVEIRNDELANQKNEAEKNYDAEEFKG